MLRVIPIDTAKWVLPLVSTVLFGTAAFLLSWMKDWSSDARKLRVLDQATKKVDFWTKWLGAVRTNEIVTTTEQIAAAQRELSRAAEIVIEASRYWPMPNRLSLPEFRERWRRLSIVRRLLLLYRQLNRITRWSRLALYAFAFGTIVFVSTPYVYPDSRPDGTIINVPIPRMVGTMPVCPPSMSDAECEKGYSTTLGAQRHEHRRDVLELLCWLLLGRILLFSYEWDSMTPLSGSPFWLRKWRAGNFQKVLKYYAGRVPPGMFRADLNEVKAEVDWLVTLGSENPPRRSHPLPMSPRTSERYKS